MNAHPIGRFSERCPNCGAELKKNERFLCMPCLIKHADAVTLFRYLIPLEGKHLIVHEPTLSARWN